MINICNFYAIQQVHVSRRSVYQGLDIRNDHSYRKTPSNAPITKRDEQTRRMESTDPTLSSLKVTFADLDNSFEYPLEKWPFLSKYAIFLGDFGIVRN